MKLGEYLPDLARRDQGLVQANEILKARVYQNGFRSYASQYGTESQVQALGIEQLYWEWLRQAYAYRRMFLQDLYLLVTDSAELFTPLLHLRNQVFKKGFDDWRPRFKFKCLKCDKEFQDTVQTCDKCGGTQFREPDPEQTKDFDKMRLNCSIFDQSLEATLKSFYLDLNIADDAYLRLNKQYLRGKHVYGKVLEIRRIHPALIEYDLDKNGVPKNSHWLCLFHRDEVYTKPGECPECGLEMEPVMYVHNHRGKRVYLPEGELVHCSKFWPSETYGYSPVLIIMQKILTLSGMDRFLYRYFFERRAPTGMILTYTDDAKSLEDERARVEAKLAEDPTYMPWVAVQSRTQRGRTDFVRLFHTLQEMDYLPVRSEIRDRIAAIYGVPQIYMNVIEGGGSLNTQTQQLKVFNDVVQADQRLFNEQIFPVLFKCFGITDWVLRLRPPEEKVEGQILQLAQQKVQIAQQMMTLGYQIDLKPGCKDMDTLDFTFSGQAINMQQQQMGMMGGGAALPAPSAGVAGAPESTTSPVWDKTKPGEESVFEGKPEDEDEITEPKSE